MGLHCGKVSIPLALGCQTECEASGLQRIILSHFDKYYLDIPRTPVPHLFESNAVPSDEDLAKIRAYICILQGIVISTETSPSYIERYRGDRVYEIAIKYTWFLGRVTIRNLPPEIIQRIVYFSLKPNFARKECLPWVASWVCSSWRQTVLGHHHLWATLPVISLAHFYLQPAKQKIVKELLRRSGDAPLSISIVDPGCSRADQSYHERLLDLLLEHAHRYFDVRLYLYGGNIFSITMSILSRSSRLRHFTLYVNCHRGILEPPRLDFRKVTESLKSIEVPWNFLSQIVLPPSMMRPTAYVMGDRTELSSELLGTLDSPGNNWTLSLTKLVLPSRVEDCSLGLDFSPVFAPQVTEIVLHDPPAYYSAGLIILRGFVTPCLHTLKISLASSTTLDARRSRSPDIGIGVSSTVQVVDNTPPLVPTRISV